MAINDLEPFYNPTVEPFLEVFERASLQDRYWFVDWLIAHGEDVAPLADSDPGMSAEQEARFRHLIREAQDAAADPGN